MREAADARRLACGGDAAQGCQRGIKVLQCAVHKPLFFPLVLSFFATVAAVADPLLPPPLGPRFPSDTLLVPIHRPANVRANDGRVRPG